METVRSKNGTTTDMTTIDTTRTVTPVSIPELRTAIDGRVIAPEDPEYDRARTVMYGGLADQRPVVIVKVADADDVARVIALAHETGLELAVRSGGHSASGHSVVDGGIVLDVSDMKAIDIDVEGRTVWAGSGLTALELSKALDEHDLAIGFGDTGSVGIGGITLGGGVGYLVRRYGLTIDDLIAAEIVTADGRLRRVDADHEPDLFWAIRGGGGNFGVVTRFRYRVHEVGQIVGGMLILPATTESVAGFVAAAEAAPDELSTIANVMPCPPMPFVPAEHHGELVVFGLIACVGDPAAAERAIAPFRALATPLADLVHPIRYQEIYPPEDPDYHPLAVSRTMFIDHVDRDVATLILDRLGASDAAMRVAQLRVLGGAMARVPIEATAFAHRASKIMVNVASFYEGPDDKPIRAAWVGEFAGALEQGDRGAYVNFVGDEGVERIHAAYPGATWDRLAAIKTRYDPTNLFHRNQNIPPSEPANT
jgi:FAD/FMN-containing dehydrogenase